MADSVAELIQDKGGPAVFAEKLRQKPGTVRAWKHRGSIPRTVWPEIVEVFPDIELKTLRALEAAAPQ